MSIITKLVTFVCLLIFTACATIINGTTQQVGISSSPTNALVSINGQNIGNTPMIADLKRKDSHIIRINLDGYEPYETNLIRKTDGWVWGNIVFGGLIGLVIDASAGGMYKLTPEQLNAQMHNSNQASIVSEDGLYISVVLQPDPSWVQVGSLTASR